MFLLGQKEKMYIGAWDSMLKNIRVGRLDFIFTFFIIILFLYKEHLNIEAKPSQI